MLRQPPGLEQTPSTEPAWTLGLRNLASRIDGWTIAALLLVIPVVVVYARPLHTSPNYDEAVYLATMRELHHGVAIGAVFLSQPPGFGWLLTAIGAVTGSLVTVRWIMIGITFAGLAAAWAMGKRAGGTLGGAVAAATLAIAPPWTVVASRLEAEVPSTTLAIVALALAEPFPLLAGAAFVLAVSMKLLALSAAVPLVLLARHRLRQLALGAGGAAVVVAVSVAPHAAAVWHQAVQYHSAGRQAIAPSLGNNVHRIVTFLNLHQPFGLLAAAAIVVAVAQAVRRAPVPWELWTWPPAAALVLASQRPLLDHHMQLLGAAVALPAGVTLAGAIARTERVGRLVAIGAIAALTAGGLYQQWGELTPQPASPDTAAAVARLRTIAPPGSLVASDDQIVPYLAGDREPPNLVDLSNVRMQSGDLTLPKLLRESAGARAFVVGRSLSDNELVLAALAHRYRTQIELGSITIFADRR